VHSANAAAKNYEAIYFEHELGADADANADALAGALECLEAVQALGNEGYRCRRHRAPNAAEAQKERDEGGPTRGVTDADPAELVAAAEATAGVAAAAPAAPAPDRMELEPELADTDPGPVPYRAMGRPELVALCAERNIPRTGPPAVLVQRLEAWDRKHPDEPPADPTPDAPAPETGADAEAGTDAAADAGTEAGTALEAPAAPEGTEPADPADRPTGDPTPAEGEPSE
jgi:hypothetical protein